MNTGAPRPVSAAVVDLHDAARAIIAIGKRAAVEVASRHRGSPFAQREVDLYTQAGELLRDLLAREAAQ